VIRPPHGRSFALILALAFIFVAIGLVAIVASTVEGFVRGDRYESDSMVARQLIDSGAAWARLHASDWPTAEDQPRSVELDVSELLPKTLDGSLTLVPMGDVPGEIKIQASVQRPGRWTIRQAVRVSADPS